MGLRRVKTVVVGLLIVGFALAFTGSFAQRYGMLLSVAALACLVGSWITVLKYWRCPKCGGLLPWKKRFLLIRYCPQCGEELDLEQW